VPFVFIHGVAVRDQSSLPGIERLLLEYVAPVFSKDPRSVPTFSAFWGDLGASFAWDRASLPGGTRTVAGMGVDSPGAGGFAAVAATTLATYDGTLPRAQSAGATAPTAVAALGVAGSEGMPIVMDVGAASDLFAGACARENAGPAAPTDALAEAASSARYGTAAVALDQAVRDAAINGTVTLDEATVGWIRIRARSIAVAVPAELHADVSVASQGGGLDAVGDLIDAVGKRVSDALQSAIDAAGEASAATLMNIRRPLNFFVTMFVGDVLAYLTKRDSAGATTSIIDRVTDAFGKALKAQHDRGSEPIVVLTHSMGGQLMYDAVTYYLDRAAAPLNALVVDFWAAAASQVGLFEEMKLFKVSSSAYSAAHRNRVPLPPTTRVKRWWNVYDPADFLSYTAAPIFDGVAEMRFMSDTSPLQAHGAYLVLPRFYQAFATELADALRSRS
jgi:hypothetical protein